MTPIAMSKGLSEKLAIHMASRLDYHIRTPELSAENYRLAMLRERAYRALSAPRLYIDTNHWVHLRDVTLGHPRSEVDCQLLRLLRRLCADRLLIVPLSCHLVEELCYQADLVTRRATASLMDELSDGVTLSGFRERTIPELLCWIHAMEGSSQPLPTLGVWTTVPDIFPDIFDTFLGSLNDADPEIQAASAKAYEDTADKIRLLDLIDELGSIPHNRTLLSAFAAELTGYKTTIWSGKASLAEAFVNEALGYLDKVLYFLEGDLAMELKRLPLAKSLEGPELIKNAKCAFLAANELGRLPTALPGLRIIAGCNAALRVDLPRKFKQGDPADLQHAAVALPYCTAFLTDGPLCHLLRSPPQSLATLYDCEVFATAEDAIRYLESLVA